MSKKHSSFLADFPRCLTVDTLLQVFANGRSHYHCTVFHTSNPTDTRPDALDLNGGVPEGNFGGVPVWERPGPVEHYLHRERDVMERAIEAAHAPVLRVKTQPRPNMSFLSVNSATCEFAQVLQA